MKRTVLFLLACLLLALPTVAQAPEKPAPADLVVTAEIVGYSKLVYQGKTYKMLNAKMIVRNTTSHSREITMMSCDWPESWVASGSNGLVELTWQPGCDMNAPVIIWIPAGEAVVFNCPMYGVNAYSKSSESLNTPLSIKLGFIDLPLQAFQEGFHGTAEARIQAKMQKAQNVYWTDLLIDKVKADAFKELTGKDSRLIWGVTWQNDDWPVWNGKLER